MGEMLPLPQGTSALVFESVIGDFIIRRFGNRKKKTKKLLLKTRLNFKISK